MRMSTTVGDCKITMLVDNDKMGVDPRKKDDFASGIIVMDKFPSTNHLFGTYRRHKYLQEEYREWRDYIVQTELPLSVEGKLPTTEYLEIDYIFGMTSNYSRRDLDNCIKFMQDTIVEYFKTDDYRIAKINAYKIQITDSTCKWNVTDGDEYCFFKIKPYDMITLPLSGEITVDMAESLIK